MANGNEILQQLIYDNPYSSAARSVQGYQYQPVTTGQAVNLGNYAVAEAGKSILAGLLGGFAERKQAENQQKLSAVMPDLFNNPEQVQNPGLNPALFEQARLNFSADKMQREEALRQEMLKQVLEREDFKFKEQYKDRISVENEIPSIRAQKVQSILGNEALQSALQDQPSVLPGTAPAATSLDATLLKGGTKDDFYKEKDRIQKLESDTYNRIVKIPSYAQFSDIAANFSTLQALANEDSRSASVGMISALARIWDPGGTVREGEYAINSNAQSALDNIIGDWREIVSGAGKLGPDAKKSILSAAAAKYNAFGQIYDQEARALYQALEKQGGDPSNVPTTKFSPFTGIEQSAKAEGARPTLDQIKPLLQERPILQALKGETLEQFKERLRKEGF